MVGLIKPLDVVHVRRAHQASVETVGPGVIRTLNRLAEVAVLFLAQSCAAVTADIVERAHLIILVAQNDHAFARNFLNEIITGLGNLTLMSNAQPSDGKNTLLF